MVKIVPIRLSADELEHLDRMAASEVTGTENRSEFIRLLLAREWNRRQRLPKPEAKDWQTSFRVGRPVAA
jgi:metal-responsive CopG/Arc/MetJ family transcriptional regulator